MKALDWIQPGCWWPIIACGGVLLCLAGDVSALEEPWRAPATGDSIPVRTSGGLTPEWTNRLYEPANLWAFYPLTRPNGSGSPKGFGRDNTRDCDNAIDALLNHSPGDPGLSPAPEADKLTLIRRASFDLTGLPPSPGEVQAFLTDHAPEAFERLVDRLLSSPCYGERMAQHWLDVTRYADTAGFSNDFDRPNAWRYRDYVVRAFNSDKPYDRFLTEQLAGDELPDRDTDSLLATGFVRMGPWEHTAMSVAAETRQQYLDDVTQSVGETFLGLGLRCARCHDHKFDPIPTRDYYRLQAIFAPVQFADRPAPYQPFENTSSFQEGRSRLNRLLSEAKSALAAIKDKEDIAIARWLNERGVNLSVEEARKLPADRRPPRFLGLSNEDLGVQKIWQKHIDLLQRQRLGYEPLCTGVYDGPPRTVESGHRQPLPESADGESQRVYILLGGSLQSPADEVSPGALSAVETLARVPANIPRSVDGRRLALARWMTDPRNPLTARVMVNRLWQWHLGLGLAGNPNNFGKMGKKPTNPRLLDWLANEFIRSGWSIKHMHRLIMTSQAYRRGSSPRRLSAEELRDTMLWASGELNLEMGGPPVYPEINPEIALQPRHIMGSVAPAYQASPRPQDRHRRSLYGVRIRTLRDPLLEVFDQPSPDLSCERRDSSTIAPQALALFNSPNSYDRALAMAIRLEESSPNPQSRVDRAFQWALGRPPAQGERQRCLEHVAKMAEYHRHHRPEESHPPPSVAREMVEEMTGLTFRWTEKLDLAERFIADPKPWQVSPETRGLADLCLVLFNSNEFAYVD